MSLTRDTQYQVVAQSGQAAMRTSLWINGLAATALLTAVGAIFEHDRVLAVRISNGLLYFAGGVILSALAIGVTYFTWETQNNGHKRTAVTLNFTAIGFVGASYAVFALGVYRVVAMFNGRLQEYLSS